MILTAPKYSGTLTSFYFNPLHDLESLWWLMGHFTFEFSGKLFDISAPPKEAEGKVRHTDRRAGCLPSALFDDDHVRRRVMTTTGQFAQYAYALPENLREAGAALEKFRRELVVRYQRTEESQESALTPAFDGLHEMFAASVHAIADVFAQARKQHKLQATQSKKRSRDVERKDSTQRNTDDAKRSRVV